MTIFLSWGILCPMRIWTEKDRKRQACIARRNKPWKHSTGPKTAAGKERAKYNSFMHGHYSRENKIVRHAMCLSNEFVRVTIVSQLVREHRLKITSRKNRIKESD